jgi:phosphoglycolate phosphatase-like HAD superfamily hydrolase
MLSNILPHRWDTFDVYLFDIDDTLLHCSDAVHYFAFCDVLQSIAGKPMTLEGVTAHGNTDIGILRDALALAGISENIWRPRLPQIREAMAHFVQEREQEMCTTVLPDVCQVLQHLRSRGASLGVATGNLQNIGQLKLRRAGLLHFFQFGGWSDECEFRADIFRAAVTKGRMLAGEKASVCVIGDTPADIRAARQNGLHVIAVATGIYPFDQLATEEPELCLSSLKDLFSPA